MKEIETLGRDGIQCENCGKKMFDRDCHREEMELHEKECTGHRKADKKFNTGDRVKFSDFGLRRLDRPQQKGKVVGYSRDKSGVRVQWDDYKTTITYSLDFIKKVNKDDN